MKTKGLARVLESIDTEALKAAAVGDKAAVKIYDAIYELLTVSSPIHAEREAWSGNGDGSTD